MHDSGLSFRHERYPDYKATREKLTDELQSRLRHGDGAHLPAARGLPHPDPLARRATKRTTSSARSRGRASSRASNVVIVSGDKDFQQLVRPGVWLLNPGRGGPASVEEQWVSVENGAERLGVPPAHVTDYLALVGDSLRQRARREGHRRQDGARSGHEFGDLEAILAAAPTLTKKRPREALIEQGDLARLSKELVTIREIFPSRSTSTRCASRAPTRRGCGSCSSSSSSTRSRARYRMHRRRCRWPHRTRAPMRRRRGDAPDDELRHRRYAPGARAHDRRARKAPYIAIDTETVIEPDSPQKVDPLRSHPRRDLHRRRSGRGFYLPLRHRVLSRRRATCCLRRPGVRLTERRKPKATSAKTRGKAGRAIEHRRARARGGRASGEESSVARRSRDGAAARAARGSGRAEGGAEREVRHLLVLRRAGSHWVAWCPTRCSRATCSIRAGARTDSICLRSSSSITR